MATRVYKYGARPSRDPDLLQQMKLGRQYYNALVEAENERRRIGWGGDSPPPPPHQGRCQCKECQAEWKKTSPPHKKYCGCDACEEHHKAHPTGHESCQCTKCKAHWTAVRAAVRAVPLLDTKALRAVFIQKGLYWGTYLVIEQAFAAAWKSTSVLRTVRFRSWQKGDVAAVQIQPNVIPTSYARVHKAPDSRTGRRARGGLGRHTVEIRIGSNGRTPVFCEPIRIEKHRELSGRIVWVHVRRRYVADREVWSVAFTCKDVDVRTDEAPEGVVAVDVSWRKLPDGSWRLGYARDAANCTHELRMPPEWTERSDRADRIRSHRDQQLVAAKSRWPVIGQTTSCQRAVRKLRSLGVLTFTQDAWVAREMHLWRYECGCRRRSVTGRRARLREWVRELRRQYATVIVKNTSHKEIKEEHGLPKKAQRQGQHAAPGETVEVLREVFGADNMRIVAAEFTTASCPSCGHVTPVNGQRMIRCEGCGAQRDCDDISTQNMWTLYRAGEWRKPTARKTTSRWAKRHKKTEPPPECPLNGS